MSIEAFETVVQSVEYQQYINALANGFVPVYGFAGATACLGESIGIICPKELEEFKCRAYYASPTTNVHNYIMGANLVYGIKISFKDYLELTLGNINSPDLTTNMICVDSLRQICVMASVSTCTEPSVQFVYEEERFFEYFGSSGAVQYGYPEPNLQDKDSIHIFGECQNCPLGDRAEFVGNDYHSGVDLGRRMVMQNGVAVEGYLPGLVHPM